MGLPDLVVGRHPFPGPGLAIRIIGEITPEKVKVLQEADAIYIEEIRKAGLYDKIWQAFSVLTPIKTVGVMGDARTYENVLALRAVTSIDGMTADVYRFDSEFLCNVASRIINEVRGINRVVYDFTSKPPGRCEVGIELNRKKHFHIGAACDIYSCVHELHLILHLHRILLENPSVANPVVHRGPYLLR